MSDPYSLQAKHMFSVLKGEKEKNTNHSPPLCLVFLKARGKTWNLRLYYSDGLIRYVIWKKKDSFTNNALPSPAISNLGLRVLMYGQVLPNDMHWSPCFVHQVGGSRIYNSTVSISILHSRDLIDRLFLVHQTNKSKFYTF